MQRTLKTDRTRLFSFAATLVIGFGLSACHGGESVPSGTLTAWPPAYSDSLVAPPANQGSTDLGQHIANEEYRITEKGDRFHAANRANNLRAWFTAAAVEVVRRTDETWFWNYRLTEMGRPGALFPIQAASPVLGACDQEADRGVRPDCLRRLEYRRGRLVEWYQNRREGIEQGFDISVRPPGQGPVTLRGRVDTDLVGQPVDTQSAIAFVHNGHHAFDYTRVVVRDAAGTTVPAWIEWAPGRLDILIDDAVAVYPLEVDPLLGSDWAAEGDLEWANLGFSVSTAGDVNEDGISDVIVGVPGFDNGEFREGAALVFLGDAGGLQTIAAWMVEGNAADARMGHSVSTAGDVNGDGVDDIIVSAPGYNQSAGIAHVYRGSPAGLGTTPSWTVQGTQLSGFFGAPVATAGDVNGDGYADVIVSAHFEDHGESEEGRVYVYHGSPAGLSTTAAWTAEGNQQQALFGWSAASAGDVNGDTYADVVVGARYYTNGENSEGRVFVFHGSSSGLETIPSWTAESNVELAQLGGSVGAAGDVNADGYGDLIVGAECYTTGLICQGGAFAYYGSTSGLPASPDWAVVSPQESARFGYSVAIAGDVNGDGFDDVIISELHMYDGRPGAAYAFHGSPAGVSTTAAWWVASDQTISLFGRVVATAGDVNADGFDDVILGADAYNNPELSEGIALVYYGSLTGLSGTGTYCGDAETVPLVGEDCDDGNTVDGDGCDSNCTLTGCGNGIVTQNTGEVCDDGNLVDGDGCDSNCLPTGCGNGVVDPAEQCDDGNTVNGDGCDNNCTPTACGNGIVTQNTGEICDDGNLIDGDGCDSNCTITGCPNGIVNPGEECDDGNMTGGDGCDPNCRVTACGNGFRSLGEVCDDGNLIDGDGCDSNCTPTACLNGVRTGNEQCDDGNLFNGDGCDNNCTFTACGNGILTPNTGELCDDGNLIDGDGCDSNCMPTGCGDGNCTPPENANNCPADCLCLTVTTCADYQTANLCNTDACGLGCFFSGGNCYDCSTIGSCAAYPNIQTCDNDPCGLGCFVINNTCVDCSGIASCGDYPALQDCNNDNCGLGCFHEGNVCTSCATVTQCPDYPNNQCNSDPCGIAGGCGFGCGSCQSCMGVISCWDYATPCMCNTDPCNLGSCSWSAGVCTGPPPPLCSEVARAWCEARGWVVVDSPPPSAGNIVCTVDGRGATRNCDDCSAYNIVVWKDGSEEQYCPGTYFGGTYSTQAGHVYGGHVPCQCGDNLEYCGTWDMQGCVPDP